MEFRESEIRLRQVLSLGRVALLGIAHRSVQLKHPAILASLKWRKMLKINIKNAGDLLKIKRIKKNLTPSHVAAKMGIATALVRSWEECTGIPDSQQLSDLSSVLRFDSDDFKMLKCNR